MPSTISRLIRTIRQCSVEGRSHAGSGRFEWNCRSYDLKRPAMKLAISVTTRPTARSTSSATMTIWAQKRVRSKRTIAALTLVRCYWREYCLTPSHLESRSDEDDFPIGEPVLFRNATVTLLDVPCPRDR